MIISANDWAYIDAMNARFPHLRANFETALAIPAHDRIDWADEALYSVLRSGYVLRGIPEQDAETVGTHRDQTIMMAENWIINPERRKAVQRIMRVHDHAEAITLDFHWKAAITRAEKDKLEHLAADVIFEIDPHDQRSDHDALLSCDTLPAKLAKDIDLCQCLYRALAYSKSHPHLAEKMDEFWNISEEKYNSALGRYIYTHALRQKEARNAVPALH